MKRLDGLDALRGIAALCVLVHHSYVIAPDLIAFDRAYLAVDFFFMLSGYVMARTYEERLGSSLTAARFLWMRYKRLWPTMFVGGLLGLPLLYGSEDFALNSALNLALLPTFAAVITFPLNSPAWSIFFELVANAVHGALGHKVRQRVLLAIVLALIIPCALIAWHFNSFGVGTKTFSAGFPRVFLSYFLGVFLWRAWRDKPPVLLPAALTLLAMPLFFLVAGKVGRGLFDLGFVLLVSPLLIAGGLTMKPGAWARFAGDLSFPLYAVHYPILGLASIYGVGWLLLLPLTLFLLMRSIWPRAGEYADRSLVLSNAQKPRRD